MLPHKMIQGRCQTLRHKGAGTMRPVQAIGGHLHRTSEKIIPIGFAQRTVPAMKVKRRFFSSQNANIFGEH